jgi:DNA-binding NtrC family response regulator
MNRTKILLAGKRGELLLRVKQLFAAHQFRLVPVSDHRQAKFMIRRHQPSIALCICSSRNPDQVNMLISEIRKADHALPIVVITEKSSETLAIAALRAGANDYFKVPFADQDLFCSCRRMMRKRCSADPVHRDAKKPAACPNDLMVGSSEPMRKVKSYMAKVAKTDSTVLITGETGTGKELAAEIVHHQSRRKDKPFVCVNCAALPETLVESELFGHEQGAFTGATDARQGKFEAAGDGTILLDEIGDMPPPAQAKILRSIENKKIFHLGGRASIDMNARVIAATNQNLERLMEEGRFRKDLFYRLNVVRIHLPPLRDRKTDIPLLVRHAIERLNQKFNCQVENLSTTSLEGLYRYQWPGNVRELFNCLEASFIHLQSSNTRIATIPKRIQKQLKLEMADSHQERSRILEALMETKWNKTEAAKILNWSRVTLYRKIEKYNIVQERKLRQCSR